MSEHFHAQTYFLESLKGRDLGWSYVQQRTPRHHGPMVEPDDGSVNMRALVHAGHLTNTGDLAHYDANLRPFVRGDCGFGGMENFSCTYESWTTIAIVAAAARMRTIAAAGTHRRDELDDWLRFRMLSYGLATIPRALVGSVEVRQGDRVTRRAPYQPQARWYTAQAGNRGHSTSNTGWTDHNLMPVLLLAASGQAQPADWPRSEILTDPRSDGHAGWVLGALELITGIRFAEASVAPFFGLAHTHTLALHQAIVEDRPALLFDHLSRGSELIRLTPGRGQIFSWLVGPSGRRASMMSPDGHTSTSGWLLVEVDGSRTVRWLSPARGDRDAPRGHIRQSSPGVFELEATWKDGTEFGMQYRFDEWARQPGLSALVLDAAGRGGFRIVGGALQDPPTDPAEPATGPPAAPTSPAGGLPAGWPDIGPLPDVADERLRLIAHRCESAIRAGGTDRDLALRHIRSACDQAIAGRWP